MTMLKKISVHEAFLLSDRAYTRFVKIIDRGVKIPEPFNSVQEIIEVSSKCAPKEEVASVADYMVPLTLAPSLTSCFPSTGIYISVTSMLRPMVKMYLFYMLCECVYSMINTMVVDITKDLLLNWWTSLKILQFAKFKIRFAFDHLKRLAHAYYGLHVKKKADNALDELHKNFQALKGKHKCIVAAKSSLIKECLREASIIKHGK